MSESEAGADPQALLALAQRRLAAAGIEQPRREARLLLAHAVADGAAAGNRPWPPRGALDAAARARFEAALARRAGREPLAFITGRQGFWTLDLAVSPATLIPRADSEAVIESLLAHVPDRTAGLRLLDLGTGTGCLLLAGLSEYREAWGLGLDRSQAACRLAASNAAATGLAGRCAFCCSDWDRALTVGEGQRFDVVLSNPPYIPTSEIGGLMPEVARFEPCSALDGGSDGLAAYRLILGRLASLLRPGGLAVLELGAGQDEPVRAIGEAAGLDWLGTRRDLSAIPRAAAFRLA